jgi:hypothetical protein
MKSPTLATLAILAMTTMLLTGCGDDENQADAVGSSTEKVAKSGNELGTFLSLHKQYCESSYKTRESLISALESDQRFKPANGFSGVYEARLNGVSYAVSPEVDGCTTDVLVQNASTGQLLFSYEQINSALVKSGYSIISKETTRKDVGKDQQEVTILERTFVSPSNEVTNLDYPADRKDQYYMTLFAKKFDPVEITEEISLNN